jgi:hypothetical protein
MDIKAKQVLSYADPLSTSTSGRLPTKIVTTEAKYFGCSTLAILWCIERLRITGPYDGKDGLAAIPSHWVLATPHSTPSPQGTELGPDPGVIGHCVGQFLKSPNKVEANI